MKKVIPFSKTIHFKTMIAEVTDIEVTHTLQVTDHSSFEGDILVDGSYKMTEASQLEEKFHYTLPFTIEVDDKYDIGNANITIRDFYFEIINEEDLKINVELEINEVEEKEEVLEPVGEEEEPVSLEKEQEIEEIGEEDDHQEEQEEKEALREVDNESREDSLDDDFLEMEEENVDIKIEPTSPLLTKKEAEEKTEPVDKESVQKKVEVTTESVQKETKESKIYSEEKTEWQEEKAPVEKEEQERENQMSSIFASIDQEETFVTYYVYIVREQDTIDSILDKYKTTREEVALYNDLNQIGIGSKIIIPCHHE